MANLTQVSAEIDYVKHNVASLLLKRGEMADAGDRLVARRGTMAASFATRHSIVAVQRMAPLAVGVEAAATGVDQTIDAIALLIADLEALQDPCDELTRDISASLADAAPHGAVLLNEPPLYQRNAALRRRRDNLVSDQAEAVRRCADALAKVRIDAHEDDPNVGRTDKEGIPLHEGRSLDVPPCGTNDDVNGDQVRQGKFSNCGLMATMMSVADADSEFLKRMVIDNEDGTYTVKPYKGGKRHDVVVDADVPLHDDGLPRCAAYGGTPEALWPLLVDKAVAQDLGERDDCPVRHLGQQVGLLGPLDRVGRQRHQCIAGVLRAIHRRLSSQVPLTRGQAEVPRRPK